MMKIAICCGVAGMVALLGSMASYATQQSSGPTMTVSPFETSLSQGLADLKSAKYDQAIAELERASAIDPNSKEARTGLANAVAGEVIPGLDTPDNLRLADRAIQLSEDILEKWPEDIASMTRIAVVEGQVKRFEEAKEWQMKVLDQDPQNAEAAYAIGMIDWTLAHSNVIRVLQASGQMDDGVGNVNAPREVKERIRALNGALVEEAIFYLNQAINERPDYDEALVYLNLAYRRKADLDWDNENARGEDIAEAKDCSKRALEIRNRQSGKAQSSASEKPDGDANPQ
jgi:tetratricopeptide (TPR) repeat protein